MTMQKRLRTIRESAGLSVDNLATKAGLSRAMLHHLEAGTRKPSLETARKICKALKISLAEFD
jgi:transcriptional regulator with XRE-family HTH domain